MKNGKIIKRYLTRKHWLFYSVESKLVLISKYNKTIDKVFTEGKTNLIIQNVRDCPIRTDFWTALSLNIFFSIKMMETIPDQLESCRYNVCVQKQLKFGIIKGISFFTLRGH